MRKKIEGKTRMERILAKEKKDVKLATVTSVVDFDCKLHKYPITTTNCLTNTTTTWTATNLPSENSRNNQH